MLYDLQSETKWNWNFGSNIFECCYQRIKYVYQPHQYQYQSNESLFRFVFPNESKFELEFESFRFYFINFFVFARPEYEYKW